MRIGLIAAYNDNYGSLLQVYATQQVLMEMGHSCEIIVYKKRKILTQIMRCFNISLLKMKTDVIFRQLVTRTFYTDIYKDVKIRNNRFKEFREKNLVFADEVFEEDSLREKICNNYDLVLLGSDQVWNPINMGTHFFTMELVPDNVYKITYAPSFGVSTIPWYQEANTRKYLNRIECISVREKTGAEIIKKYTGRNVKVVCDPTILINKKKWFSVGDRERIVYDNYLFCYFLGNNQNQRKLAKEYAQKNSLKIVALQHLDEFIKEDISFADFALYDIDPFDFISLIKNATSVMTDSFHGTIFSILYEKNFYSFPRFSNKRKQSTNSRIDNILNIVNLQNRKLTGYENIEKLCCLDKEVIDYQSVENKLAAFQKYSLEYLESAFRGYRHGN